MRKTNKSAQGELCCDHKGALRDRENSTAIDRRLARIEGQIRGIRRMVSEGRYCIDVLSQVQAVQESLKSTSAALLETHLKSCVDEAFASGVPARREAVLKELVGLVARK